MKNRKKIANVPNLRFSNFTEEWEETRLGDNCDISMCKRIFANETHEIEEIPFYKIGTLGGKPDSFIRRELFEEYKSKYNYPEIGEVMITCSGTVGKCIVFNGEDSYYQDSNIVWINNPKKEISNEFLHYVLSNINWGKLNSTTITRIYSTDLKSLILKYPQNHNEQNKLVTLLSFLDNRLSTQIQIIEELKSLKKVLRNNLCKQFTKIGKSEQIANLLNYEQPTNYIVANTNYSDDCSLIPVLTANKAFILGYTNEDFGIYNKGECVIFDDFTMDLKYVDFPFKVKSSAIKILTAKLGVNLRFIYEYLSFLKLTSADHKRHYISEIEPMYLSVPKIDIQNKIANILSILDKKISLEIKQCDLLVNQKKYLLSQMFI